MINRFNVKIIGILFEPKSRKILVGKSKGDKKYSFLEEDLTYEEELDRCLKIVAKIVKRFVVLIGSESCD